ncbi:MAG: hypothetical protein ABWW65_05015 [Thermoprotei archaeon]
MAKVSASILYIIEAFLGSFYVAITRTLTPIMLVRVGYSVKDLLLLNGFAGLSSLLFIVFLYRYFERKRVIGWRLVVSHFLERVAWLMIPFMIFSREFTTLSYILAFLTATSTPLLLNASLLELFTGEQYRRVLAYRSAMGASAGITAQLLLASILSVSPSLETYTSLYLLAFGIGSLATITVVLGGIPKTITSGYEKRELEVEVKATNTFILLLTLLIASNLLGIVWVPWLLRELRAPDYLVVVVSFAQAISSIPASMIWRKAGTRSYRVAIIGLSIIPFTIYFTRVAYLHPFIAFFYGFLLTGSNFYASIAYSLIVRSIGVIRASALLVSANSLALAFTGLSGYLIGGIYIYLFIISCIAGLLALTIGILAIPEIAIIPPEHSRIYARLLYNTSINGYSFIVFALTETIVITLKIIGLIMGLSLLVFLYRVVYYIIMLSSGG